MTRVKVRLKDRSYDILIGRKLLKKTGAILKNLKIGRDAVVITNKRLLSLYGRPLETALRLYEFTVRFEIVPDSEKAKSNAIAAKLINRISAYDKRKEIFIIAFGGGVIGDSAGFVAAVYKRGVPYIQFPTTLVAQVDSAIGGKVALDLPIAKNLVGAFYQPKIVLSDTSLIKTLPLRQVRNGLAEVIKYGVIKNGELFAFLETNYKKILKYDLKALEYIVLRSSKIKANVVSKDELDRKGLRATLNYGHTIGHAIETASGYSNRYNHGEAIAIGMVVAARIASLLGLMKTIEADRIEKLLEKVGLPTRIKGLRFSDIYDSHLHDKKFIHGKNRFILPTKIGRVKVAENVPDDIIRNVLKGCLNAND